MPHADPRSILRPEGPPWRGAAQDDERPQVSGGHQALPPPTTAPSDSGRHLGVQRPAHGPAVRPPEIAIVDDAWLTVGLANLNEHSLFNDTARIERKPVLVGQATYMQVGLMQASARWVLRVPHPLERSVTRKERGKRSACRQL